MIPGVGGWIFWVIIWVWILPLIQCRLIDVRSWKLWHIKWKPLFGFKQTLFCSFCHKTFPAPSPCAQHKMQLRPLQTNISFLPFYVIWMSFLSLLCQLIHPSRNLKLFSSEHKETLVSKYLLPFLLNFYDVINSCNRVFGYNS